MEYSYAAIREGLENKAGTPEKICLEYLCNSILEPLRDNFGAVSVDSGYRSRLINGLVKGSKNSAHMFGRAADIRTSEAPLDVMRWLLNHTSLQFDQVIWEFGGWTHVSVAAAGASPRRQALMIFPGCKDYHPFNPRVITSGIVPVDKPRNGRT